MWWRYSNWIDETVWVSLSTCKYFLWNLSCWTNRESGQITDELNILNAASRRTALFFVKQYKHQAELQELKNKVADIERRCQVLHTTHTSCTHNVWLSTFVKFFIDKISQVAVQNSRNDDAQRFFFPVSGHRLRGSYDAVGYKPTCPCFKYSQTCN